MGAFGTSKEEESQLRDAVHSLDTSKRYSEISSHTESSAYETADEELPSRTHSQSTISRKTTDYDDAVSHVNDSQANEDVLNDQSTIHNNDDHDQSTIEEPLDTATIEEATRSIQEIEPKEGSADEVEQYSDKQPSESQSVIDFTGDEFSNEEELIELERRKSQVDAFESELQDEISRMSTRRKSFREDKREDEGVDPATLDYDSPDDQANPLNWPTWRRWFSAMTVAMICLVVSLGSSLYVAGVFSLEAELGVSQELAVAGLTFYLIGLAMGPAIAAPLSEIFGRKYIYLASLPLSMLFIMGVGLSHNIASILVLRFFSGFFASPAMAVAGGTISDVFRPEESGTAMGCFCLAPFLGPVLGPVIGGFVAERKDWRWTLWVNLMWCGAILPAVLVLPETYKPAILRARAKQRGIKLKEKKVDLDYFKVMAKITLTRPMEMLLVEPIVMVFSIYISFVFAILFGFFEAYPVIFSGVYHMQSDISGLTFLGVGIGLVLGVMTFLYFDRYHFFPYNADGTRGRRDDQGNMIWDAPESKLIVCKIGGVCLPISLFWLAWTARPDVHFMAPIAAGVPFGYGLVLIFLSVIGYFSFAYPPINVASALAANNLLRYVVASVFPLFVVQMIQRLKVSWALSLFGFISIAMVPIPWVFEKYGPKFRSSSRYGYAALFKARAEAAAAAKAQQEAEAAQSREVYEKKYDNSNDESAFKNSSNSSLQV